MISSTVLIQDFVQVERPYALVASAILADPRALFAVTASEAYHEGERLSLRLAPSQNHPHLGKQVTVDVETAYQRDDRLVVPIHWWASGPAALFPRLDADLEVAPLGEEATQITLMGRYDPPLAGIGRQVDRLLLHRVAEASVRSFLTGIARSLTAVSALTLSAV